MGICATALDKIAKKCSVCSRAFQATWQGNIHRPQRGNACSWWARWHIDACDAGHGNHVALVYERAETLAEARVAWEVFLRQEGQEHWQCACGEPIAQLFRTLTITLKE